MMRKLVVAMAAVAVLSGTVLGANAPKKPVERPEAFEALVRCRTIEDERQRLRCFDEASARLEEAAAKRDLVVVDRKQIRDTKRSLFGLDIPNLNPFGGEDDQEEEIRSVEGVVASAQQDGMGRWTVRLEDGSVWAQTDNNPLAVRPRKGHKVKVNKAAMGSYMMRINGQPGVRAKRQI